MSLVVRYDGGYAVVEEETGQVIKRYKNRQDATDWCHMLSTDYGFGGPPPTFFCAKWNFFVDEETSPDR